MNGEKSKKAAGLPYRPGVGAMLLNGEGEVFVGRRSGVRRGPRGAYVWQMPQGGIDDGETPVMAVMRELAEETGTDKADIIAETKGWLTYDLPDDLMGVSWGGRYRGQTQKWFALRFTGVDADFVRPRGAYVWQMPQGGIDDGETPVMAVMRELAEETGTDKADIIAETKGWLTYDLPDDLMGVSWGGRYRGQTQKWFALRFTGVDADFDLNAADKPEFTDWKWVAMAELPRLAVPFKRRLYDEILAEFQELAESKAPGA